MTAPPGWFEVLLDEDDTAGAGLPERFRDVYGADWRIPDATARPYVCINFVTSRDGRVSFNEPDHMGGGDVSGFDARDRWLMGLLRARADAVLVGEGTVRAEPDHLWTAEAICPDEAAAYAELRRREGRRELPLQVFLSQTGELPAEAAVFRRPELEVVVVTTSAGAARARETGAAVLELGVEVVDLPVLVETLRARFEVRMLLCEGGPRVYGSILAADIACDEFLTLSPLVLGDGDGGAPRPSLVEGVRFDPSSAPRSRLLNVRRGGDHLYLRSRYWA